MSPSMLAHAGESPRAAARRSHGAHVAGQPSVAMAPSSSRADRPRISDLALLLVAVVLLALSVRVVLALDAPSSRIGGDPAVYDEIGVSIAGGEGWSRPLRHPAPGLA